MTFVEWFFLLGAIGVAGPILAHLLARPRFRKVPFTMLRFLRVGQKETQARRNIRNLLLMMLRCLIIAALALLFAGPRILRDNPKMPTNKSVYLLGLDDSLSMAYRDGGGSLLEREKQAAAEYVSQAQPDAIFQIYGLAGGQIARDVSRAEALGHIKRLEINTGSGRVTELLTALGRLEKQAGQGVQAKVLLAGDFSGNVINQLQAAPDPFRVKEFVFRLITPVDKVTNTALADAQVTGNQPNGLRVNAIIANFSESAQTRRLVAKIGDKRQQLTSIELAAAAAGGERRSVPLEIKLDSAYDPQECLPIELILEGEDGLKEDDTYYLSVQLPRDQENAILLQGSSERELFLLKEAFSALGQIPGYETTRVRTMLYNRFDPANLGWATTVVCAGLPGPEQIKPLQALVQRGGRLIIFAARVLNPVTQENFRQAGLLGASMRRLRIQSCRIQGESLAGAGGDALSPDGANLAPLRSYNLAGTVLIGSYECDPAEGCQCLWRLTDGQGFLFQQRQGNGTAILVNTSADGSLGTLTKSPAVIAFCRYLLGPRQQMNQYSFRCGERAILPASELENKNAAAVKAWFLTPDGARVEAPVKDGYLWPPEINRPGWLRTMNKPSRSAGINVLPVESEIGRVPESRVRELMGRLFRAETANLPAETAGEGEKSYRNLWKYFAWAALGLIIAEAFIANRVKR